MAADQAREPAQRLSLPALRLPGARIFQATMIMIKAQDDSGPGSCQMRHYTRYRAQSPHCVLTMQSLIPVLTGLTYDTIMYICNDVSINLLHSMDNHRNCLYLVGLDVCICVGPRPGHATCFLFSSSPLLVVTITRMYLGR